MLGEREHEPLTARDRIPRASSISFDARASSPLQAASISFGMLIRRLPVRR